jgi:serine/threonine protein phosphatase PrpC
MENEQSSKIMQVGVKTQAGQDYSGCTKINQDNFLKIEKVFGLDYNIFGVFDGHGNLLLIKE